MLLNLIIMTLIWLSSAFNYYLISYQLKYLEGDLYLNGIVSSLSETAAAVTSSVCLHFFGIKRGFIISFVIAAAGMVCLIYTDTDNQMLLALFILGSKFGVTQAFNMSYVSNVLIFPTLLLATSYGTCNIFARLGTIFAPYVAELEPKVISKWVFTAMMILSIAVVFCLRVP